MPTLCIRYTLDPRQLAAFEAYAAALPPLVERCGGHVLDYYLPTRLAGPTDTALGFIAFDSLAAYEAYRRKLDGDPEVAEITARAAGSIVNEERSFLRRSPRSADARPARPLQPPGSIASPVEHVYFAWDEALSRNDVAGLLALYAPDARLESPLVPHLLGTAGGVLEGRDELRRLLDLLAERKPEVRRHHRTGYLTDGRRLVWEYPRAAPDGDQMDFAEVMELDDAGLIKRHCVYWGWFGVGVLHRDAYRRG